MIDTGHGVFEPLFPEPLVKILEQIHIRWSLQPDDLFHKARKAVKFVAHADDLHRARRHIHGARDDAHGVGDVEKERTGADLLHVGNNFVRYGRGAQRRRYSTRSDGH